MAPEAETEARAVPLVFRRMNNAMAPITTVMAKLTRAVHASAVKPRIVIQAPTEPKA